MKGDSVYFSVICIVSFILQHIKDHLNVGTNLKWVDESYCLSMDVKTLRKTDIFIFAEFSGAAFEHITTKSNAL